LIRTHARFDSAAIAKGENKHMTQEQLKQFTESLGWNYRVNSWSVVDKKGKPVGEINDGKWIDRPGFSLFRNKIKEAFPETR
jgi:hypothetical protein